MIPSNFLDNNNDNYDFEKRQKNRQAAVIVMSLVSLVVIVFGLWQIRTAVFSPFVLDEAKLAKVADNEKALKDLPDLSAIDTDGDGISDYDELYVYGTSPYLEDTDGDGISDYDEIFVYNTDPLCPEGKICSTQDSFAVEIKTDSLLPPLNSSLTETNLSEDNLSGFSEGDLLKTLAEGMDASTLRGMLLNGGVAKDILDQISDEELLLNYQEALNKQNE